MKVEEFDIISILGEDSEFPMYKVKQKQTNEVYIWHTLNLTNLSEEEKDVIRNKVKKRSKVRHAHLLQFFGLIEQPNSEIAYIMTEFCKNYNLETVIHNCIKSNIHLCEELVCRILYQIAIFVKTSDSISGLSMNKIFLDEQFTIKLFNFTTDEVNVVTKLADLGSIIYQLCTLQTSREKDLLKITFTYSNSLSSLISFMINDNDDIKKNINKILCHPTVLIKSSQWDESKFFINVIEKDTNDINSLTIKFGKLRSKELALRAHKQKLTEWEQCLLKKSKELKILERTIKEKLQQAELYLKRCKNLKNKTNKPESNTNNTENLNATYASCVDSPVVPTSTKLDASEIAKPPTFTRTLSERRIRFKGHSPLKEVDFNRRRSVRNTKQRTKKTNDWFTCSEETEKSSVDGKGKGVSRVKFYENLLEVDSSCQPIQWTEENKRQAFSLLRTMKGMNKENCDVKQTYL